MPTSRPWPARASVLGVCGAGTAAGALVAAVLTGAPGWASFVAYAAAWVLAVGLTLAIDRSIDRLMPGFRASVETVEPPDQRRDRPPTSEDPRVSFLTDTEEQRRTGDAATTQRMPALLGTAIGPPRARERQVPPPPGRGPEGPPEPERWAEHEPPVPPATPATSPAGQLTHLALPASPAAPWWTRTGGMSPSDSSEHAADPPRELADYQESAQIAQCPACGGFALDVSRRQGDFRFVCHGCAHRWEWQPGERWPAVCLDPSRITP